MTREPPARAAADAAAVDALHAEIARLEKVNRVLMDRVERSAGIPTSGFAIFQTALLLEEQVRQRTLELEAALRENERANRALRESELQIRRLAFHDPLTQVPNRRLLMDRLAQALAAVRRSRGFGTLIFLDLDDFKPLNDRHGHGAGDRLLVEVARRMLRCVRESDTVARLGGDEFVAMIGELHRDAATAAARATGIAVQLRDALAAPYRLDAPDGDASVPTIDHRCGASVGLTLFGPEDDDPDAVIRRADRAMYRAKSAGGGAVHLANGD